VFPIILEQGLLIACSPCSQNPGLVPCPESDESRINIYALLSKIYYVVNLHLFFHWVFHSGTSCFVGTDNFCSIFFLLRVKPCSVPILGRYNFNFISRFSDRIWEDIIKIWIEIYLCKIWGTHGNDYEECSLLGYKNPVRTSHEIHYVFATDLSLLMLCKIWVFHDNDNEECRLLGCGAMWVLLEPTFRRKVSPPLWG
jgi:hypothetical protein